MSNPMMFVPLRTQEAVEDAQKTSPIVGNRVELQLLTTLTCNLKCTYCSLGVGDMVGSQGKVSYTTEALDAFIAKHLAGHEIYVTFYGGEPTLNLKFIQEVMARYPPSASSSRPTARCWMACRTGVLTNLSNILLSIDGGEAITDGFRGRRVPAGGQKHRGGARPDEGQLHGARD
jgi:sulfatase maturation enzyme AslB (radical SAM superfamily)